MKIGSTLVIIFVALYSIAPVAAVEPEEILKDPKLEQRARSLSQGLRCLVCQNQSIDDSNSDLARDLRAVVRERLKLGYTDAQVLDYVVARYGEFVLLNPRLNSRTALLWLGPILILSFGIIGILIWFHQRNLADTNRLTIEEEKQFSSLITEKPEKEHDG